MSNKIITDKLIMSRGGGPKEERPQQFFVPPTGLEPASFRLQAQCFNQLS